MAYVIQALGLHADFLFDPDFPFKEVGRNIHIISYAMTEVIYLRGGF